jgi:hypothetical protein
MRSERKTLIRFIQEAIDTGTTTVEEVHKSIANLPLRILEERQLLRGPAREAKRLQDQTIGAIYDVIRDINERIGNYASQLLAEAAKRRTRHGEAADEKRHAPGAAAV